MEYTPNYQVEEAIHVFHESEELADLLLEQNPKLNGKDLTSCVQRHTGDHLGVMLRTLGYASGHVEGIPVYIQRISSPQEARVLALTDAMGQPFRPFSGPSFFVTNNVKGLLHYFTKKKRLLASRAKAIVPLSTIGGMLGFLLGEPELGAIVGATVGSLGALHSTYSMVRDPQLLSARIYVQGDVAIYLAVYLAVERAQRSMAIQTREPAETYWEPKSPERS
ncbi:hypothetical protein HYS47_05585 [Candidatus Woesearchaeota archaeon]|nr:hypothetical protein [Candidatus Woesearchaeota archaeon]